MSPAAGAVRRATLVALSVALGALGAVGLAAPGSAGSTTPAGRPAGAAAATPKPLGYTPVGPARLLDTRTSLTIHTRGPASTATLKVTGVAGVPSTGVEAVVLNVTAIATTHSTFITVYPAGTSRPTASNLNVALRHTRANQVVAQVGAGGAISFYNSSGLTDVLVDISGWFADGSSYTGRAPLRMLDTRSGGGSPRPAASTLTVQLAGKAGIPTTGVSAVVLNLTGISVNRGTFVTAYPAGSARPATSNLNLVAGQTAAVLVVATPNANGQIALYNSGGPTHLLLDVAGWFTGTTDYHPLTPARLLDSRVTGGFTAGSTQWPVQVSGRGGVPTGATAAVLTITVVEPSAGGHVTVFPYGTTDPGTSTVNVRGGETTANLAIVRLPDDGRIAVLVRDKSQKGILVDIVGWIDATPQLRLGVMTVPTGLVGEPFSLSLEAVAGWPPYSWSLVAGSLPAGVTLAASGKVSGKPTDPGTTFASFRVTDGAGQTLVTPQLSFVTYPQADVWAWGNDTLGFGTLPSSLGVPAEVTTVVGSRLIATGPSSGSGTCGQSYALQPDGTVLAWGGGLQGALGNNSTTPAMVSDPVQVSGLDHVTGLAASYCNGYALKDDGTVWAWGNGKALAIGDGTNTDSLVPVPITALSGVTQISGGYQSAYAVTSGGTVWSWGDNSFGQLGNGGVADGNLPVQVSGLTDVVAVAGGLHTAYAVTSTGEVWAWGEGAAGELGDGTTTAVANVPVQVGLAGPARAVAAGQHTGYAVLDDGTVWSWGVGTSGELGNDTVVGSTSPVQVSGLSQVTTVAAAKATAFAVTADGQLWTWGSSLNHLLGDGVSQPHVAQVPQQVMVPAVTSIAAHAAGAAIFVIGES
jgi:alpha-tubulin suppressor-like RCC1 family protein